MKVQTQNYFYEDDNGIPLFSIKLFSIENLPKLIFDCSLNLDFSSYPKIQKTVEQICVRDLSQEERNIQLQEFYLLVNKINGIEKRFARINLPYENDPTCHGIENDRELIFQHQFEDYSAFTEKANSQSFCVLEKNLRLFKSWKSTKQMSRKVFEKILKDRIELEQAYIEVYSKSAKFFSTKLEVVSDTYEFYIMETSKIDLVFFISKAS